MKKNDTRRRPSRLGALWISLAYLFAGILWIMYSDRLLALLVADAVNITRYQSYKGWLFVALTALLVYAISMRQPEVPASVDDEPAGSDERRVRLLFIAFSGLFAIAIIANLVFSLLQSRHEILQDNAGTGQKFTQVLEEQTGGSIRAVEIALLATTRTMQLLAPNAPGRQQIIRDLLEENVSNLPNVRAIWVLDAAGNMIHDSQSLPGHYNLADREYFQVHRDHPGYGLFIDKPSLSKLGVWFIGISRRIDNPDGSFGGVIVAALEPKYLQHFYESIKVGKDGILALFRTDGTMMLRAPDIEGSRGKKLNPLPEFVGKLPGASSGSYSTTSRVDGMKRIYFYRQVANQPLVVVVGMSQAELLAAWRTSAQSYVVVSLAFLLAVGGLCYLVLKELRRRAALNRALGSSEAALAAAQKLSHVGSWQFDIPTRKGYWSDEMYRLWGLELAAEPPTPGEFLDLLHPDDRPQIDTAFREMRPWSGELRSNPARGPLRYFITLSSAIMDEAGKVQGLTGTLQDITERRQAEEKLRLAARVFEHTRDGLMITDVDAKIVAVNASFERITGYSEAEALGRNPRMLHSDRHDAGFYQTVSDTLLVEGHWRGEIWNRRKNGEVFPEWLVISAIQDEQGRVTGYVSVFTDLTEIRQANQRLEFLLNHDPLTGLPTRPLLVDRLQQALDAVQGSDRQVAVLLLNLDRLQRVNDSIGHDAGDALLQEMARRLQNRMKPGDTLARPGSDEFVIVMTHFADTDDIITFAQQMLAEVAMPYALEGQELTITASIGVSIYPADGLTPSDLLKGADTAMSHVKNSGRNGFGFFTAEMNQRALHWMSLEHRLRRALTRNELSLHYQPQVSLHDGRICGVEALIRWNNPELGNVSPADFIPLAEDTGLIIAIGEWVIHTACVQNKAWQDAGLPPLRVAVNVSAYQVTAGNLPDIIGSALQQSGLAPRYLEVELTESVLMGETEAALRQIDALRGMGVSVSLDDFGTGYSSLGYLGRFTLDKLKVDQGFVRNITEDPKSAAIAHATIALGHGVGIKVVAEGVETEGQLAYLRQAGCDQIQGYLVSKPVPAKDLQTMLARSKVLPANGENNDG